MFGSAWLADRLTRGYARLLDGDGVVGETVYRTHGETHRVYWIDAERWPIGGQYTPFGTVVLNEHRLGHLSEEAVDYVFLHEVGHGRRSNVATVSVYAVRSVVTLAAVLGLPWVVSRWVRSVVADSPPTGSDPSWRSVGSLGLIAAVVLVSWLDEGAAEMFAVSKLGAKSYRRRRDEFLDGAEGGLVLRSIRRLIYPHPRLVIAADEYLGRNRME